MVLEMDISRRGSMSDLELLLEGLALLLISVSLVVMVVEVVLVGVGTCVLAMAVVDAFIGGD